MHDRRRDVRVGRQGCLTETQRPGYLPAQRDPEGLVGDLLKDRSEEKEVRV
jgi:hypothetical protein